MIDTSTETLITMAAGARAVPPAGVHVNTFWRWSLVGLSDGRKLETVKVGGRVYTSLEALERFLLPRGSESPAAPTSKQRQRQIDAAEKELAAYGV